MSTETKMNKRSDKELEVLYKISQAMIHQHGITGLLKEVLDIMETEMGLSRGTLTLRRPDTDIFVIEASHGLTEQEKKRAQYKLGEGITGRVAQSGKTIVVPDITKNPDFLNLTKKRKNLPVAFLCAPIVHQKQVVGTISIDRPTSNNADLKRDMKFLNLVADLLAEVVADMREQMQERESLLEENRQLRRQLGERFNPSNIVGKCSSMCVVYDQIAQVADSPATVLIRGESGTGKELVARAIHMNSPRRRQPFICVNCAALPENLIESELFGHEKGSFTGATAQRKGRFELAHGGTLFLDEIGDISPNVQVRLLRVLQERNFERLGGHRTISIDVRVIAATSRNLEDAMKQEKFREDLYYRLNVFPIHLPPLRERRSDIMLLTDHFTQHYSKQYNRPIKRISTSAINMMMQYHWPGNVRELENCIERAVLTSADSVIHGYHLPPSLQTIDETNTGIVPKEGASFTSLVESYEREIIIDALKQHRGNAAACARHLQTTPRIINYKIRKLTIDPKKYK